MKVGIFGFALTLGIMGGLSLAMLAGCKKAEYSTTAVNKDDFFALTEHNLLCRYSPVLSKEINSPVFICLGEK